MFRNLFIFFLILDCSAAQVFISFKNNDTKTLLRGPYGQGCSNTATQHARAVPCSMHKTKG